MIVHLLSVGPPLEPNQRHTIPENDSCLTGYCLHVRPSLSCTDGSFDMSIFRGVETVGAFVKALDTDFDEGLW